VASHDLPTDADNADLWMAELTETHLPEEHSPGHAAATAEHVVAGARRLHSDFIIVGSSGFATATADPGVSVACSIARQAPCPVLVAKAEANPLWGAVA
jgi:nucleotide-binding universal stress UspA family protein